MINDFQRLKIPTIINYPNESQDLYIYPINSINHSNNVNITNNHSILNDIKIEYIGIVMIPAIGTTTTNNQNENTLNITELFEYKQKFISNNLSMNFLKK